MQLVTRATRARWSLAVMFLVMGFSSMAWIPRIPEIKSELGLNDAQFGLMLAASSVGAVLGAQYSGRLVHRIGSKTTLRISQIVMPIGPLTMGLTMNVPGIMAGLFVMGLGYAAMDIAANSQAVIVEKITKRRFLASLHGAWSIGTFVTAVFGGAVVGILTPGENLVVLALVAVVIFIPLTEQMLPSELDEHKGIQGSSAKLPWFGGRYLLLWAFAIGSLGSFVAEGASMDWGGILLAEHMGVAPGFTASVFASFSLAMIISRFTSDRIMEVHGSYKTVLLAGILCGWPGHWPDISRLHSRKRRNPRCSPIPWNSPNWSHLNRRLLHWTYYHRPNLGADDSPNSADVSGGCTHSLWLSRQVFEKGLVNKETHQVVKFLMGLSTPGGTRTPNLLIRSQMLYPLSYRR